MIGLCSRVRPAIFSKLALPAAKSETSRDCSSQRSTSALQKRPLFSGALCRQREEEERNARTALLVAQQNRAATVKAAGLDAQIAAAEAAVNAVDKKEAVKEADPQSASMAKAIGTDQNIIAALSQAFFAIAIEFGSGV